MLNLYFSDSEEEEEEVGLQAEEVRPRRPRYPLRKVRITSGTLDFNERFRLSANKMERILLSIGNRIEHPPARNHALSTKEQLLTTLRWLGTGAQYHNIGDAQGVSKASVCRTIKRVVEAINDDLVREYVKWPDNPAGIAEDFLDEGGMPFVSGCLDRTLIIIDAPVQDEAAYVDRHGNHSIDALLVSGPDMISYYVLADWPGNVHDTRVLRNSGLYQRFEGGWHPFPDAIILGDSAYSLRQWLIPPDTENPGDVRERRFLRSHKATRRLIESAIGILREKFPCSNHVRLDPVAACQVIKCCVTLCKKSKEPDEERPQYQEEENDISDDETEEEEMDQDYDADD